MKDTYTRAEIEAAFRRCDDLVTDLRERGHSRPEAQAYRELKMILGVDR